MIPPNSLALSLEKINKKGIALTLEIHSQSKRNAYSLLLFLPHLSIALRSVGVGSGTYVLYVHRKDS